MNTEQERIAITKYDLYYESRMTKVESAIEHLADDMKEIKIELREIRNDMKSDYRWLFGIMLGGFLALLGGTGTLFGLMAHGFKWF